MKKLLWIRTGLLLIVLIFAVLGGNFLYTGAESASPLDVPGASLPLKEGTVMIQTFSPEYAKVTAIALAFRSHEGTAGMTGDCTVALSDNTTGEVIYTDTFSMEGVPDDWYLDLPVNCRLDTDKSYDITVYVTNCPDSASPYLRLIPQSSQIPEITASGLNMTDNASLYDSQSMAIRFTYDVLVPARLGIFIALLIGILLCLGAAILFSHKKTAKDITPGDFLSVQIHGIRLIHILFFSAVTIAAVIIKIAFLSVKSNDFYSSYEIWIYEIRSNGGLASLGKNIGDYPPLYMTLVTLVSYLPFEPVVIIKLIPCIFDFILAAACVKLAKQLDITQIGKKLTLYAVILLNPLTLLDSAAWGQCDSLYSTFILLTLSAMCGARLWKPDPPMESSAQDSAKRAYDFLYSGDGICILFALAISFKLQAVFFLPVICLMWIMQKRNVLKPVQLLWVPIIYTVSCIPMYLAGRSLFYLTKDIFCRKNKEIQSGQ